MKIKVQSDDGRIITAKTDKNGKFEIKKMKAGKYRVEPPLSENYYIKGNFEEVEIDDRGTADVILIAYFTGKVRGQVVDKNGVGFNSALLQFFSINEDGDQKRLNGYSDGEKGGFSVEGVPPGEYALSLNLKNNNAQYQQYYYPGTFKRENAAVFKVGLNERVEGLKFILPDEFQIRTVEGQVFWKNGKPAGEVYIALLCPQNNHSSGYTIGFDRTRNRTDENGKFKVEGFAGEVYQLKTHVFKEGNLFHSPPRKIVLTENLKNIKLVLSEERYFGSCEKKLFYYAVPNKSTNKE